MTLPTGVSRIGLAIVILFTLAAIFAPALTHLLGQNPYDPVVPAGVIPPTPPGPSHPLGTDSLGRDLLARLLYGARISLSVGVMAEGVALLLGLLIGGGAGPYGGIDGELLPALAQHILSAPPPPRAPEVAVARPRELHPAAT